LAFVGGLEKLKNKPTTTPRRSATAPKCNHAEHVFSCPI
jgi:hypothetical protein